MLIAFPSKCAFLDANGAAVIIHKIRKTFISCDVCFSPGSMNDRAFIDGFRRTSSKTSPALITKIPDPGMGIALRKREVIDAGVNSGNSLPGAKLRCYQQTVSAVPTQPGSSGQRWKERESAQRISGLGTVSQIPEIFGQRINDLTLEVVGLHHHLKCINAGCFGYSVLIHFFQQNNHVVIKHGPVFENQLAGKFCITDYTDAQ